MSFEIIDGGFLSTIQDNGRWGVQDQGIPVSGFMDVTSANIANAILGNDPNAPMIEMCMKGITLLAHIPFSVSFYGADMELKVNDKINSQGKIITLNPGDQLKIGFSKKGTYGYLAFKGVLDIPKIYNSASTYLPAKFGGYFGRALQKGDRITLLCPEQLPTRHSVIKARNISSENLLECFVGPEWNLLTDQQKQKVINSEFTISKDINRIGYRLEGEKIELGDQKEIISSGMVKGTVQLTSGGDLIIMMADAPTTGGYLRILNLNSKACDSLAQMNTGGKVKFSVTN
ncbi:biotin-dependent carboxyltransferase family protein [Flammeovirga yaeyamensis]|uniref:Biotin-dependent carboxyltransferase family protein n=1 Tax=Flammeovirga yaeyamensis TaxID=367791 RepID=A0AAX1N7Z5_9BACT|nr:biotin-dependent carboxyltransferase family protein [Flammeovirga yaeyamensis]MBB3699839.1 antagonist of KipI [Flammeovirga yaeyamensis]NMF36592.1 biotin-dependent carboxyltransferase family protein [Flammeovirga yaeyamensis]QWG02360.1 biotin-dependent carboxyltransferase family protein [Flammeovirga yaeyamensis]